MLPMDDAAAIRAFKVAYLLHLPSKDDVHPMDKDQRESRKKTVVTKKVQEAAEEPITKEQFEDEDKTRK
jgi:hypothetical protein